MSPVFAVSYVSGTTSAGNSGQSKFKARYGLPVFMEALHFNVGASNPVGN